MPHDESDSELRRVFADLGFITGSEKMMAVLRQASRAACLSDITVLVEGETGTGKQVLARAIHQLDQKRHRQPFVTVNCSAINEALAESELFGHERGAFSGAVNRRVGLFQAARGGSLLLDDVNDLPLAVQAKLLDVLQRGVVRAVGSDREAPIDVRILAASNQPLAQMVRQSSFRADLYYRLKVVHLSLPPLRERTRELPALILEFAHRHQNVFPGITGVDPALTAYLRTQPLEGNVRELEYCIVRMLFAKTEGTSLGLRDWMAQQQTETHPAGVDLVSQAADTLWRAVCRDGLSCALVLRLAERRMLEIAAANGTQTRRQLAERLKTSERNLYHKLRAHNLTGKTAAS